MEGVAGGRREAGLHAVGRVGLIGNDCVDWLVCDFATFFAGCVVVPVFPTQALDNTKYILEHSGAKLLFVDSPATQARLAGAMAVDLGPFDELPGVDHGLEGRLVDEVVFPTLLVLATGFAGGVRDRQRQV